MTETNQTEKQFLKEYTADKYPKPSVACDIVLFTVTETPHINLRQPPERELRMLMIRRGKHPFKDQWALPGGFLQPDETVGQCAKRELKEETGINVPYLEQLYTFSKPDRDPRTWVLSSSHMALVDSTNIKVEAGDDAADAAWFKVIYDSQNLILRLQHDDISLTAELSANTLHNDGEGYDVQQSEGIAFDHAKIIVYAIERLRSKLEYTDLAFHLLPEQFTLSQMQNIYELILGRPLFAANFRKEVQNKIEDTGEKETKYSFRPSALYRKKQKAST